MATVTMGQYREAWKDGARGYPEADTLDAMWQGVKRKRKPLTVHVAHAGLAGHVCAGCGLAFDAAYPVGDSTHVDERGYAYVDVDPGKGEAVARHYYCAWGETMAEVAKIKE